MVENNLRFVLPLGLIFCLGWIFFTASCSNKVTAAESKTVVYIAGDSTACNYERERYPRAGWGQVIQQFFNDSIIVRNEAVSGRSSKSFIQEGILTKILAQIKPNDYLFIQFGHNDEKKNDEARYTEPSTTYKSYLTQYIEAARKGGAIPVLLTPINRRSFDSDGIMTPTHGDYPQAVLELGTELKVPVIDTTAQSKFLFEKLGVEKTKKLFLHLEPGESPNYPKGVQDNTHFCEHGATEIARLVIQGIKEAQLPLAKFIRE